MRSGSGIHRFQSTPPVAGGRCAQCSPQRAPNQPVSIHAPRCRGAMPATVSKVFAIPSCFNPRPPLPGGDAYSRMDEYGGNIEFQSTPPVAGGRCTDRISIKFDSVGFNPRPPLPGGDASDAAPKLAWLQCFNPRPPLPGGDANTIIDWCYIINRFQSTPPVAGGRCAL